MADLQRKMVLSKWIVGNLNREQAALLAANVGVEYDGLAGGSEGAKAVHLIGYLERRAVPVRAMHSRNEGGYGSFVRIEAGRRTTNTPPGMHRPYNDAGSHRRHIPDRRARTGDAFHKTWRVRQS